MKLVQDLFFLLLVHASKKHYVKISFKKHSFNQVITTVLQPTESSLIMREVRRELTDLHEIYYVLNPTPFEHRLIEKDCFILFLLEDFYFLG